MNNSNHSAAIKRIIRNEFQETGSEHAFTPAGLKELCNDEGIDVTEVNVKIYGTRKQADEIYITFSLGNGDEIEIELERDRHGYWSQQERTYF